MRVRFTEPARSDVTALLAYTAEHWPQNVERAIDRIREVERLLSKFPTLGPMTARRGVRRYSLKPLPYLVFYTVGKTEIEILRVYHMAQRSFDPGMP